MAGSKVPTDPNMTPEVRRFLDSISRNFDGLTPGSIGAAGLTQSDFISGAIKGAANQDYRIIEKIPYGMTFTGFTAKLASGTLTATLKINSTAITTGAINVTSSQASVTPTAANVAVADDALVMTISSISSPVDLSFTINYTRTLVS
jgi:hypothetical protein